MRMCCGCNQRFEQRFLIRLQISNETQAVVPVEQKRTGRSAWVCCNISCIRKIQKHPKKLYRSLRIRHKADDFTTVVGTWLFTRLKKQFRQMYTDGVVIVSTYNNAKFTSEAPYIFPTELYNMLHVECADVYTERLTDEECIQIHRHHLLQSTIRYATLLVELKLDSIV